MENRRNLLVTLADVNYIRQAKQLFSSVYWNSGWEGDYMLLSHEIPEEELKWFRDKGILVKKCTLLVEKRWGADNELSPIIADKFYLFTQEFKKWKNIVYLDADIIVKASLDGLTKIKYFGAVQDIFFKRLHIQFYHPDNNHFNNRTYNLNVPAFNAGVISFNTDIISPGLFNELNILLKDHISAFIFGEQTALNLYFYKKWKKLPLIYNIYINYLNNKLPKNFKYIVLHFAKLKDYTPLWEPENSFYQEWKTNLEKAEYIDLDKIQKVKKWSSIETKYYSFLLRINLKAERYIDRISYTLRFFFVNTMKSFFVNTLKSFFVNTLKTFFVNTVKSFFVNTVKSFFLYIFNSLDRLLGNIGVLIKKHNPDLYDKLRKLKGRK